MKAKMETFLTLTLNAEEMRLLDIFLSAFDTDESIADNYLPEEIKELEIFCNKLRPILNMEDEEFFDD